MSALRVVVLSGLLFVATCVSSFSSSDIMVTINGANLKMEEPPVIVKGSTLVPLRAIFEALGVQPAWDPGEKKVSAKTDTIDMNLIIGANAAMVNGKLISLNAPGTIVNGRTMVPARFIAETFGATVGWDPNSRTVQIYSADHKPIASKGTIKWTNPQNIKDSGTYEGDILMGKANGNGTIKFFNGDFFEGSFVDNKRNGYGVRTYINGDKYEGEYKDDTYNGQGTFTWTDGVYETGAYVDGALNGFGKYLSKNTIYEGDYVNGEWSGQGTLTFLSYPEGRKYVGQFSKDKANGQGTMKWKSLSYTGTFVNDEAQGEGIMTDFKSGVSTPVTCIKGVPIEFQDYYFNIMYKKWYN